MRNPAKAALDRLQCSEPVEPVYIASASAWSSGRIPASIGAIDITGVFAEPDHVQAQLRLLRDIFIGPNQALPPRPEPIAPLAERIYASEWNLMPILGEWLQENGYWSGGEHCLDPSIQHVKGCWVVDWVTGREWVNWTTELRYTDGAELRGPLSATNCLWRLLIDVVYFNSRTGRRPSHLMRPC